MKTGWDTSKKTMLHPQARLWVSNSVGQAYLATMEEIPRYAKNETHTSFSLKDKEWVTPSWMSVKTS